MVELSQAPSLPNLTHTSMQPHVHNVSGQYLHVYTATVLYVHNSDLLQKTLTCNPSSLHARITQVAYSNISSRFSGPDKQTAVSITAHCSDSN